MSNWNFRCGDVTSPAPSFDWEISRAAAAVPLRQMALPQFQTWFAAICNRHRDGRLEGCTHPGNRPHPGPVPSLAQLPANNPAKLIGVFIDYYYCV